MKFIRRFYWILELKEYLRKNEQHSETTWRGAHRATGRGLERRKCAGARPVFGPLIN